MGLFDGPKLSLDMLSKVAYYQAHTAADSAEPSTSQKPDQQLSGTVSLSLKKKTTIRELDVSLHGWVSHAVFSLADRQANVKLPAHAHIRLGMGERFFQTLSLTTRLQSDLELEAGTHTFGFTFRIPPSTAPHEDGPWGSVIHTVKALAHGLGRFGDPLMASEPVMLVVSPWPSGQLAPGYHSAPFDQTRG